MLFGIWRSCLFKGASHASVKQGTIQSASVLHAKMHMTCKVRVIRPCLPYKGSLCEANQACSQNQYTKNQRQNYMQVTGPWTLSIPFLPSWLAQILTTTLSELRIAGQQLLGYLLHVITSSTKPSLCTADATTRVSRVWTYEKVCSALCVL